ncbi:MAG: undecaprenyl-diphosphate phosphatase [Victivallaceae bacterium]|nr:undecaprenyl-diphosphate phosphatase [Victivallaceae bacterium]
MSDLVKIIILAVVQGVAEFLPISSSGHLAVIGKLLDWHAEGSMQMNVTLHAGTLLAILIYYFKELLKLLKVEAGRKVIPAIIIGSVPAAIIGFTIKGFHLEYMLFGNLVVVGTGFICTGIMLLTAMRSKEGDSSLEEISLRQALLIGIAQGIAIIPGISRSGSTISAGLKCGLKKADSATFSFMLAIPVIGGAALLELITGLKKGGVEVNSSELFVLGVGFAVAAVVGYFSLALLLKVLKRGKLTLFGWYVLGVGILTLGWKLYSSLK